MNRIFIFLVIVSTGLFSCRSPEKEIDKLELAKNYYKALDQSNTSEIPTILSDSLLTKETAYDYEQVFSLAQYVEWMRWDSVFKPEYEVLRIVEEGEIVKAKVSKIDKRIFFLHEAPIVTTQLLRFDGQKIISIETLSYDVFNDSLFVKNRERLLTWIDQNHSELTGFIYDQTQVGGEKYLKAIELYTNR